MEEVRMRFKWLNPVVKGLVVLFITWVTYEQLYLRMDWQAIWSGFLNDSAPADLWWLLFALLLVPANWGLEAAKWHLLMSGAAPIGWRRAIGGVLAGVTISLFTPNRVGEYGGRILVVRAADNWHAVVASLVGSFSQLFALLSAGLFGLLYFAHRFLEADLFLIQGLFLIGGSLLGLLLFLYFQMGLILPLLRMFRWPAFFKRFIRSLAILENYSGKTLGLALLLSISRYLVYSVQFYILLLMVGVEAAPIECFAGISTAFLIQTSIPLPPALGLLTRGQVALFVWPHFGLNELSILLATYCLFVINLLLPALMGTVIILRTNVTKSLGYGSKTD